MPNCHRRPDTFSEAQRRVRYLKDQIENKDAYRILWRSHKKREEDVQILYRLTWCGTASDVNREVNNGRGPADFKISRGVRDMSIVEFKLARNPKLKRNLRNQVEIYQRASDAPRSLIVIVYFTEAELLRAQNILAELGLSDADHVALIDARRDSKPSASQA